MFAGMVTGKELNAEIVRVEDLNNSDTIIDRAVEIIKSGGIIVYPTDTSYGLGCDPRLPEALDRLTAVKRRDKRLGVPLLFSDFTQCETYHEFGSLEKTIAKIFWPGQLTLIVTPTSIVPQHITADRNSVAIRVPNHIIPRKIAHGLGAPVVGTSANRSNGPSPFDLSVALDQLGNEVDLYIDGGQSSASANSTIIGVESSGAGDIANIKIYREGALSIDAISNNLKVDTDALKFWTTRFVSTDM
jgi:tRNA threonylcarbamoyl adenosine modification protein (Sua5/YciO/YrdC/YwlC family)